MRSLNSLRIGTKLILAFVLLIGSSVKYEQDETLVLTLSCAGAVSPQKTRLERRTRAS